MLLFDNNPLHYMTREEHEQFRHDFPKLIIAILVVMVVVIFGKAIFIGIIQGIARREEFKHNQKDPYQQAVEQVVKRHNEQRAKEREEALERQRQKELQQKQGGSEKPPEV